MHTSLMSQFDNLYTSQCKRMLENNYKTKLSDAYLFQEHYAILKLIEVVRLCHAPDDDGIDNNNDNGTALEIDNGGNGSGDGSHTKSHNRRKQNKDCGEMLGCPHGVIKCAIM